MTDYSHTIGAMTPLQAVEAWARARGTITGPALNLRWPLGPVTTLLWAACVESGLTVDVGACKNCRGDCANCGGNGVCWMACPACSVDGVPTGRERIELARLVCEAAEPCPGGCDGGKRHTRTPGAWSTYDCPECRGVPDRARESLAIESDRLQSPNAAPGAGLDAMTEARARTTEALGVWLAAWLRGECVTCCGAGYRMHNHGVLGRHPCDDCNGSGVVIGSHPQVSAVPRPSNTRCVGARHERRRGRMALGPARRGR